TCALPIFFKVAMIRVDEALRERPELDCHMLLTVHDELVFEVPQDRVEPAATVVADRMEHAIDREGALRADVGWGPNWAEATPAGHGRRRVPLTSFSQRT